MFSSRTNWNLLPNRLTQLLEEKRNSKAQVADLTESNPTHCGFHYDSRAILGFLAQESSLRYDPDPKGLLVARMALCEYYRQWDVRLDPEQIVLTASTSEAYSFLLRLLCNPGDSVLVPQPSYPLLEYLCQLNDVHVAPYRLAYDGEWRIDLDSLRSQLSNRSQAIILVHPNNPTGSYVTRDEGKALVNLAKERNLSLIVDEVFSKFDFGVATNRVSTFASTEHVLTFTLGGISKLLGLPQMKLGWVVLSGPREHQSEALKKLEVIADTYLSVNTAIQHALPELLKHQYSLTNQIRDRILRNLELLRSTVSSSPGVSVFSCEGGWNAILCLPQTRSDEEWCEFLLESSNVLFHPGHFYSLELASCLVLSLLPDHTVFLNAITESLRLVTQETAVNK